MQPHGETGSAYRLGVEGLYEEVTLKTNDTEYFGRVTTFVPVRFVAGIAGSNPAWGMDVCLLCLHFVFSCTGRGLCDGLITRPE
jgi:hypothetical protein